jgi:hypothetical protein
VGRTAVVRRCKQDRYGSKPVMPQWSRRLPLSSEEPTSAPLCRRRSREGYGPFNFIKFSPGLLRTIDRAIFASRGVPSGFELRFSGCPFDEPDHRQKNYRPNDGVDNFRADAANENKPNPRQQPAGNEGANNADHDVADEPEAVARHD